MQLSLYTQLNSGLQYEWEDWFTYWSQNLILINIWYFGFLIVWFSFNKYEKNPIEKP